MKTNIIVRVEGIFNGIYRWGTGFVNSEAYNKWEQFWNTEFPNMDFYFWNYMPRESDSAGALVSVKNCIYMHPMEFNATLVADFTNCRRTLPKEDYKYEYEYAFQSEVDELYRICKAAAEFCGGTFELRTSKEEQVVVPDQMFKYTGEEDYLRNCTKAHPNPYRK